MDDFQATQARTLFPRGPSLGLKAAVIIVLALGLMLVDARSDAAAPMRSAVAIAAMPVQWAAGLPQQLSQLGEHFSSRSTLLAENDALRQERLHLQARLQKLDGLAAENTRIRALLLSSKQLHEQVLIGEILSASMDPYRHYVTVNKGSIDGIYEGQPLIDAHGIMGQVTEVTSLTSNAILLTDPNHGVPVEFNRTGLQTVAHGAGESKGLRLPFLPSNTDVQVGDLLVSSGLGGRYPAGYPVGVVYEVRHEPGDHFLEVLARPAAHLNQGRELLLVWKDGAPSVSITVAEQLEQRRQAGFPDFAKSAQQ